MKKGEKTLELLNYMENYIEFIRQSNYAENTIISYEISIRYYYSYVKAFEVDFKKPKGSDMVRLRTTMKKYKASTINARLSAIRHFYDYLVDIDEVETNPIRKSLFIRHNRKKPRPLNDDEVNLLKNYMNKKADHIRLAFQVLIESGIRVTELTNLTSRQIVTINRKHYIEIHDSKGNKSRLVPISPELYKSITEYINSNSYLLGTIFNLTNRGYQYHAEQFSEKYNIDFSVHSCRHTFATNLARKNVPVQTIQKILGHENIQTTMYYIELSDNDILNLDIYT